MALKESPIVHDGWKLHQTVEEHLWCVTLDDLKQFRRLVGHAIAEGVIKPTSQDPFDTTDMLIGPSMCLSSVSTHFLLCVIVDPIELYAYSLLGASFFTRLVKGTQPT